MPPDVGAHTTIFPWCCSVCSERATCTKSSNDLCHAHQRSDCHATRLLVAYHRPLSHLTARLLSLSPQRDKIARNRTPHWSTVLTPSAVKQVPANGYNFLINFNTTYKRGRGSSVNIVTRLRIIRDTSQNTRK
jgi:hypothetical protein